MADSDVADFDGADQQDDKEEAEKPEFPDAADPNLLPQPLKAAWSSGLCDCCNNPGNAFATALCPCITFGQIAEMVEDGHVSSSISAMLCACFCLMGSALCCSCKYSGTYRTKLRRKFNLAEAPALDWITHVCCVCCALCQEYRELQSRGLDPSLGWKKNAAKNQQTMRPPVNQRMNA